MFKWLKGISFFKQYREPVDTILKGLQNDKFEISATEVMAGIIRVRCVVLRNGLCEISITLTEYRMMMCPPEYTSSTDDWMTTEELQAVYGLALALYNTAARMKVDEVERMRALAISNDQRVRMDEVANQLKGISDV